MSNSEVRVSKANSTQTNLAGGATYTGSFEYVGDVKGVGFSCYSSSEGTLYVDYSPDNGTTVRTLPAYFIKVGFNKIHCLRNFRGYVRLRFVNGSTAQTDFDLNLLVGQDNQPVAPAQFSYDIYSDAVLTRIYGSDIDIAGGKVDGISMFDKFGRNEAVSGNEDVAFQGGTYAGFPIDPTAETFTITSTSTDDDVGGAGAEIVKLYYLDANWEMQTVDVNMNGTGGTTTVVTGVRAWRIKVVQSANGANTAFNAGDITVTHSSTTANKFLVMDAGKGQSEFSGFTVPANHVLLVDSLRMVIDKAGGSTTATCGIWEREFDGAPRITQTGFISVGVPYKLQAPIIYQAKTDFIARILSISTGSAAFTARFGGKLIRTSDSAS